jgi:proline iminopeptidase
MEFQRWFADNIEARLRPEDKEARQYWMSAAKHGIPPDETAFGGLRAIAPAYFFDRAKGLAFAAQIPKGTLHPDANSLLAADLMKNYDLRDGYGKCSARC